jgi:hypothetical protein
MMLHVGKQTGIQTAESMHSIGRSHHVRMDWLNNFLILCCDNSCHKELMLVITFFVCINEIKK